jgi:hypothetical protein
MPQVRDVASATGRSGGTGTASGAWRAPDGVRHAIHRPARRQPRTAMPVVDVSDLT